MRLDLDSYKSSRSLHLPTKSLKFFTGFNCTASENGKQEWNTHSKDRGGGGELLTEQVQLSIQLVVTSFQ